MSEWIRHRGSKSMPKCLEGKRFEVRHRDGVICEMKGEPYAIKHPVTWIHSSVDSINDIMAYCILGDITPPDYSKGFPVGTTAKDVGAKVGDEFVVVGNSSYHGFKIGDIVRLSSSSGKAYDNKFEGYNGSWTVPFCDVAPIPPKTAIELQAEEVGIPEPVQLVDDAQDAAVPTNKYQRTIKGVTVDVYDVLAAFGVTCQARGHAIKKLLMAGQRGHKDEAQDLREAVQAIERSIDLVKK